ncbi:DUF6913 domain-containing protein [Lacinutrix undariae]
MFLSAFKEKSNQKYINKLLTDRTRTVNKCKVQTVGVVLNFTEFTDVEVFKSFFKTLNISETAIEIVAFVDKEKDEHKLWGTFFTPKDFGWKGSFKNNELKTFLNKDFDALICFYKQDITLLNVMAAASKANFKIGLSGVDDRLYDLMIDVKPEEVSVFNKELKKYLTILNKL